MEMKYKIGDSVCIIEPFHRGDNRGFIFGYEDIRNKNLRYIVKKVGVDAIYGRFMYDVKIKRVILAERNEF